MKCPKYIEEALRQRAEHAARFSEIDAMLSEWLRKKNLIDSVEDYDICGGCESYVNPYSSSDRILRIIKNA